MKASLKNYRQAPRKVRLVTDLVKGKRVADALETLTFLNKRAAEPIEKLIKSAVANAKEAGKSTEALAIDSITVDKAAVMKRFRPRARGSASPIHKHSSHVNVVLVERAPKGEKVAVETAVAEGSVEKVTAVPA